MGQPSPLVLTLGCPYLRCQADGLWCVIEGMPVQAPTAAAAPTRWPSPSTKVPPSVAPTFAGRPDASRARRSTAWAPSPSPVRLGRV